MHQPEEIKLIAGEFSNVPGVVPGPKELRIDNLEIGELRQNPNS